MAADDLLGGNLKRTEQTLLCPKDDPRRAEEIKLIFLAPGAIPRGERVDPAQLMSERVRWKFEKFPLMHAAESAYGYPLKEGNYSTPTDPEASAWRVRQQQLQSNVVGFRSIETGPEICENRKRLIPSPYGLSAAPQTPQNPNYRLRGPRTFVR